MYHKIMGPETIADVGATHAKEGLVGEVSPGQGRHVTRKAHLVTVVAETTPPC